MARREQVRGMPKDEQPQRTLQRLIEPILEWTDGALYTLVAVAFLVGAVALGIYSVATFVQNIGAADFPKTVIEFINDLLLVLIILEVVGTVRSYLQTGTTSLKPFLYIGIISATRRILAIGAQSTIGEKSTESQFRHLMIDLGVNGAVVLALAAALFLFGHERAKSAEARQMGDDGSEDSSLERNAPNDKPGRYDDIR